MDYWDNSDDYEKIVLTAAALLEQKKRPAREFSVQDLHALFTGSEPTVKRLERRGLMMAEDGRYRLFSSAFSSWILYQIIAELTEEQTYHVWLAENRGAVERIAGKQGSLLREILPKIRSTYRPLIITWASDPRTVIAMAGLLKSTLALVN